jgi:anti-sigma factor RsiW
MNNDELLAMYLDGTLSEGQRTDFDRLLQTSPTFAQEVREILTIQGMLFEPALDDAQTSAFLRTVEDNLATAVIAAGAAATAGTVAVAVGKSAFAASTTAAAGTAAASTATTASAVSAGAGTVSWASSLLSTIFASTTSMVVSAGIGIATIASGAAVVNYVVKKNTTEKQISERQATEPAGEQRTVISQEATAQNAETQVTPPKASTADHTTPDITAQRQADAQNGASAPAVAIKEDNAQSDAQTNAKPREYTARISGGSMQGRYADAIADYGKQLQAKEASHDRNGAAFVEKSLGALLRQAGNASESRLHLNNAVKAAHELGLQELEGEARAELALVDAAEGKKVRAVQGLQEALGILNTTKSTTVARWQKELDKLTGK